MSTAAIILEIEKLPLQGKMELMERLSKSIQAQRAGALRAGVDALLEDYRNDHALTAFTALDGEPFYESK